MIMEKINFAEDEKYDKEEAIAQRIEMDFKPDREWDEQEKAAIEIIEKIQEAGFEAYFAGGAVRDYIKGKKPNDVDICTSASSNDVRKIFEKGFGSTVYFKSEKAQENKIINIKTGGFDFEVASFRKDVFLADDISGKIKAIESSGYSKRLIEYDNDYQEFLNGEKDGIKYELLNEGSLKGILKDDMSVLPTDKAGVYRIEDGDQKYDILFFKVISDQKDAGENTDADDAGNESGAEIAKKQKQVAGRHPDLTVTKGVTLEEDARRRDFTMNGLFFDPKSGKIIDCVGGYDDVINKKIKFIGDPVERIREDKIRILRFFRFKGVMGLDADEESIEAIRNWFSSEDRKKEFMDMFYLNQRIKPEFEKILKSRARTEILDDMMNEGVLELIMPEIAKMKGVRQPAEHHEEGDVWEHTKKCLEELISLEDYRNKYPGYDPKKIEQEYLDLPGSGREALLSFEEYVNVCRSRNIKADENKYSEILEKWRGKMPSKEEYVSEFSKKDAKDIEREYLELAWSVLLHDSGKVASQTVSMEAGSDEINFNKHEKASVEISKFFMYIEKEAKWHRGQGLNMKGERLKGLNYETEFAGNVVWLVANHMHHLDFSRMSRTKQEKLMEDQNFDKLLELWKADVMGSRPVKTEKYDDVVRTYEEYKKANKEKVGTAKKENIIKPDEVIEILQGEKLEMRGGLVRFGKYNFSRAIPILIDYLNNLFPGKEMSDKDLAKEKLRSMIRGEKIFDKIAGLIEEDEEVKKIREGIENVSGRKQNLQIKKMNAMMDKRVNEIFDSFFSSGL